MFVRLEQTGRNSYDMAVWVPFSLTADISTTAYGSSHWLAQVGTLRNRASIALALSLALPTEGRLWTNSVQACGGV